MIIYLTRGQSLVVKEKLVEVNIEVCTVTPQMSNLG